nr:unnamed protein product [Callosobruchus chinensis]
MIFSDSDSVVRLQQESRLSPVSEERLEWGRAMIAEICKPEWPAAIKWPHGDVRNMIDASQTLQDFFSQRRAQSPGLHRQIHTHSTKYLNYFPPTRQHKCLRTGGGLPSILYQQVIQRRKKHLEIWSSDSENSESELEEDMEDMCRPKSVLLGEYQSMNDQSMIPHVEAGQDSLSEQRSVHLPMF